MCNTIKYHHLTIIILKPNHSMIRSIRPFFLLVLFILSGYCYAQDLPVNYKTLENEKHKSIIDSINQTLNRIHLARNISPDSALKILYGLYNTSLQIGYFEGIGGASAEIGGTFITKGDYKKAEQYILYSQLQPRLNEYISTNAINNMATIYESRGNYSMALQYLKRAMSSKDRNVANTAYNNYIALLMRLGRYKEALYYIDILKSKAKALQQNKIFAAALCNEAAAYGAMKDYRTFDSIAAVCHKFSEQFHFKDIITYNYINIGTSYSERGDTSEAVEIFSKIKEDIPQLDPDYQMGYYLEYGKALYNTKAYKAAIDNMSRGIQLGKRMGINIEIEPVYNLARAYKAIGDHADANEYYEQYIRLKDSFQNMDVQKSISEYEVKFRTAEKDNELLNKKLIILGQSNKIDKKNTWILLSAVLVIVILILFFVYYKYTRQNLLMLKQDLALARQKAEINFMKAMIQGEEKERKRLGVALHNGIGSQLTAINLNLTAFQWKNNHIPEINRLNDIITQIQDTAIEVRKTAHNLLPTNIADSGLYHAVKEFTHQFKNSPVAINVSKTGNLDTLNPSFALLIYRIIQELINNAIKHAAATSIDVHFKLAETLLSVSISDNGKGFDDAATANKGMGLEQIQKQLELLNGVFKIYTQPQAGTVIYFEVDLKHSQDGLL